MVIKFLMAIALVARVHSQEVAPVVAGASTSVVRCNASLDVHFMVDSSSSVGEDNFQLIKDFLTAVVNDIEIGRKASHISIARYNSWVDPRLFFNTNFNKQGILDAIANIPYYGQGTQTGQALKVSAEHHLQKYNGWREGKVPTVCIVLTDGKTQDSNILPGAARQLRAKCTRVIAIGVGNAVEAELVQIATAPASTNVIMVTAFSELQAQVDTMVDRICEVREDVNECLVDNGGCSHVCVNTFTSFYCECNRGYTLGADTVSCVDVDECNSNRGGCSDKCTNTEGSFTCSCSPGFITMDNGKTCVADSCYGNTDCQQNCVNIVDGTFFCACGTGYTMNDDGRTCTDINECLVNNGGCEGTCNNTMGSYVCMCPEGQGLRPDRRTCGLQCYTCQRALSNEDCLDTTVCLPNQKSCQTHTRRENGVLYISKGCKQTEACANNFIQNPRTAWSPTQCNVAQDGTSVCRCCCHVSLCNIAGDCTIANEIGISCPEPFANLALPADMNMTCSGSQLGDVCRLNCPVGYAPVTGAQKLVCTLKPRSLEGFWNGMIGVCGDIDECATNNGGCSHTCTNTNGSYVCSCPGATQCSDQLLDLFFILDSSSSVGAANFNTMLGFVSNTVAELNVGQDATRVGVLTYNNRVTKRFDLKDVESNADFNAKIAAIDYSGEGTKTAQAIRTATQECFRADRGRRAGVPLAVVIITDGRSQDSRDLADATKRLYESAKQVFAIGVTNRVNEAELLTIAKQDTSRYTVVDDFGSLDTNLIATLSSKICVQPVGAHFLASDTKTCDFDECSVSNGGCSFECTNTVGSYYCTCTEGEVLAEDGRTCITDACLIDNGGCSGKCINKIAGIVCLCGNEFVVNEGQCDDYNECSDENGGCSHTCDNLEGGFECRCPEGMILGADKRTCEVDSCFNQVAPLKCAQTCTNVPGGSYYCSCQAGYTLNDDSHNCTEINECDLNNGGCEKTCTNTPGSYRCECPAGLMLRNDGKTCGVICYTCQNVLTNEECDTPVACQYAQDACFTTMRTRDNITRITKGCQQTQACINNLIQNPRDSGEGPSQCNRNQKNSKCECCCTESMCNAGLCPYNFTLPGCPSFEREDVVFRGLQANGEVFPGGVATVTCKAGYIYSQAGAARTQLNCNYNFVNATSAWDGEPSELDVCVDINECNNNNGSCVSPAVCVNLPGSYECQCPEEPSDYVLTDGIICERDECSDPDNGGCSHNCSNTVGSFVCYCPPGMSLVEDKLTCDPDECMDANGGCNQLCVNILAGFECRCYEGYRIDSDGKTCVDINECETAKGGCSHSCKNLVPGFECSCPEGMILRTGGFTCKDDPCFDNNGGCAHICTVLEEGFVCSCKPGYELLDDGSCVDIDECINLTPKCQNNCTNFDGGYRCECPDGQALKQDGRNCGRACYSCQGAATNEECNAKPLEVCPEDADSCENQVRVHEGKKLIFKRCKQTKSCSNNFIQNPRNAWLPTQCNGASANDVCRCCCKGHLCNAFEKPCASEIKCNIDAADVTIVVDSSSSVKYNNFQKMKSFTSGLFSTFNLGQGKVHSALIRYNGDVDERFGFDSTNSREEVLDAVDAMPYKGSGTKTGQALNYVADTILKADRGARKGVVKIVVTITDGKAQDNVASPSKRLRDDFGAITFAIGIGAGLNKDQLNAISGSADRTFEAADFNALSGVVLNNVQRSLCYDVNECNTNNGGCSHTCNNTQGSYFCECPDGMHLDADFRTCVTATNFTRNYVDECANNKGGCSDICIDTLDGFNCSCNAGSELGIDGKTCFDADECANSPCSHSCVNTMGSYFCECPEDHTMGEDGVTCVKRVGDVDCLPGYMALGHSCMRLVEEAANYAGAETTCTVDGGRLVKIADNGVRQIVSSYYQGENWIGLSDRAEEGVFVYSDGTQFTFTAGWADKQPGVGDCVFANNYFYTTVCTRRKKAICELPRSDGFVVFSHTWPNGAQGKIYFPTDVNTVKITFPHAVKNLSVWFGSRKKISATEWVVSQNDNQRQSSKGQAEFVCDMGAMRFPDNKVVVAPYEMS